MADAADPALNVPAQPQCQFFVVRKKRLCRMTVRPGRQYCGEHEPQPNTDDQENDQRVPCPNDPKHTCYLSKLEKHLTKCNARKGDEPPYIEYNINCPEETDPCPRIPLRDVPEETLARVIDKVNALYDKYVKDHITTYTPPAEHHSAVRDDIETAGRGESSRRHLRQASRLMQLAEDEGLESDDTCYVELGAGKGMLSYYVGRAWCSNRSRVIAVDRAALRHKRDNRLRRACAVRLRADLRHLAVGSVPQAAAAAALVGLAKHLCGVAMDYAIRSLTSAGAARATRGALLATCCHHRCERAPYVGAKPLQELGITDEELNIMFGIVSWATCGDGRSRELRRAEPPRPGAPPPENNADYTIRRITDLGTFELNTPLGGHAGAPLSPDGTPRSPDGTPRSPEDREVTGRRAKALLDYGRVLYFREKGFEARLCYYVPTTESLENVCIVAKKEVL